MGAHKLSELLQTAERIPGSDRKIEVVRLRAAIRAASRAMTDERPQPPHDEHPVFRALFEHASAKPDAVLDYPWGDTVFKVRGKIFVWVGRNACTVKPFPEELDLLLGRPDVVKSKYIGRYGWITLTVNDDETLELAKSLIDDSYAQIANKRQRERASAAEAPGRSR